MRIYVCFEEYQVVKQFKQQLDFYVTYVYHVLTTRHPLSAKVRMSLAVAVRSV
jgi:hypothetical protein